MPASTVETTSPSIPCRDHLSQHPLHRSTFQHPLQRPHFFPSLAALIGPAYKLSLWSKGILTQGTPSSPYLRKHGAFPAHLAMVLETSVSQL